MAMTTVFAIMRYTSEATAMGRYLLRSYRFPLSL